MAVTNPCDQQFRSSPSLRMAHELQTAGYATCPEPAHELTVLSIPGQPDQELDAVVLDGDSNAFLGRHATHASSIVPVGELMMEWQELLDTAAEATSGKCMAFKHWAVGHCYMPDEILPGRSTG